MYYNSKYGAKKCTCGSGHVHDSKKEACRCNELMLMQRAGEISEVNIQKKFCLIPSAKYKEFGMPNEREVAYFADFTYMQDGKMIVEDTKGYKTKDYIIKRKMFKDKYCKTGDIIFKEL